ERLVLCDLNRDEIVERGGTEADARGGLPLPELEQRRGEHLHARADRVGSLAPHLDDHTLRMFLEHVVETPAREPPAPQLPDTDEAEQIEPRGPRVARLLESGRPGHHAPFWPSSRFEAVTHS